MLSDPVVLILAAGAATRMRGADKLLQEVDGQPQLRRLAIAALATGWRVLVALPVDRPGRGQALAGVAVTPVVVDRAAEGLSASLRAGLAAAAAAPRVMVVPGDMPELDAADLCRMAAAAEAAPEAILRAVDVAGVAGHPVVFPNRDFAALISLQGDTGAREVLARHRERVIPCPLPGHHATLDLDTPEEWAAWQATRAGRCRD
jgi:CTP:molybdopterin cytidylyltransferase MocA